MAFYKDYSKDKKKKDYGAQGSWDDEGSHYRRSSKDDSPQKPSRPPRPTAPGEARPYARPAGDRPAFRPGPRPSQEGSFKPSGDRPAFRSGSRQGQEGNFRPAGDKPAYRGRPRPDQEGSFRPAGDKPAFHARPRPDQEGSFRPAGDRPAFRARPRPDQEGSFRPAGDRPAFRGRPRPDQEGSFRPAGDRPAYRGRPRPDQEGSFRPAGDRPAFRARPVQAPDEPAYKSHEYKPPVKPSIPAPEQDIPVEENLLSGRNPIREAIKSGRDIEQLLVAKGDLSGSAREIIAMAKEARIPVKEVERARLDAITKNHQGLLAFASAYKYSTVEEMLAQAKEQGEDPFVLILDGITDPHNLGAVIRTAECVGAHGVIVPERRAVGLTPAAVKASAGAVEHVKVARVTNLARTLEELQKAGLWITAAVTDGQDYRKADLTGPLALVIGSEGEGIGPLVRSRCDRTVALPLKGKIGSLNASVAAGVLMYAVLAARTKG